MKQLILFVLLFACLSSHTLAQTTQSSLYLSGTATTGNCLKYTGSQNMVDVGGTCGDVAPTETFSATPTIDLSTGSLFKFPAMTANVTSVTFVNASPGEFFEVVWTQAASGGPYTVTYGSGVTTCPNSQTASTNSFELFMVWPDASIHQINCTSDDSVGKLVMSNGSFPTADAVSGQAVIAPNSSDSNKVWMAVNGGTPGRIMYAGSMLGNLVTATSGSGSISNTQTIYTGAQYTLPANAAVAGMNITGTFSGTCTTSTSPGSGTYRLYIGTTGTTSDTEVARFVVADSPSVSSKNFLLSLEGTIQTIGSSGTAQFTGVVQADTSLSLTGGAFNSDTGTVSSLNTTVNEILSVSYVSGASTSNCTFLQGKFSTGSRL
jgi:hypothetical protein